MQGIFMTLELSTYSMVNIALSSKGLDVKIYLSIGQGTIERQVLLKYDLLGIMMNFDIPGLCQFMEKTLFSLLNFKKEI